MKDRNSGRRGLEERQFALGRFGLFVERHQGHEITIRWFLGRYTVANG